nr:immunoglobulin heavy chain junction region [Mus musculus]MBK4195881.1 immunoglobulin heavy chain junction region [Mus musculus]
CTRDLLEYYYAMDYW